MTRVVLITLLLLAAVEVRCQQQICLNNCGTNTKAYQACIYNSANAEVAKECGVMRPAVTVPQTPKCQPAGDGCNTVCCLGNDCTETLVACEAPKPDRTICHPNPGMNSETCYTPNSVCIQTIGSGSCLGTPLKPCGPKPDDLCPVVGSGSNEVHTELHLTGDATLTGWEPLDVPAIQDSRELSLSCREAILNQPLLPSENLHCVCTNTKESCTVLKWDCDDKTRFLLPSADGKYHCLKLVPEVKP